MSDAPADLRRGRHEHYRHARERAVFTAEISHAFGLLVNRNQKLALDLANAIAVRRRQEDQLDRLCFATDIGPENNVEITLCIGAQEARALARDCHVRARYAGVVLDRIENLVRFGHPAGSQGGGA